MTIYEDYIDLEDYYISGVRISSLSVALELGLFEAISLKSMNTLLYDSHVLAALLESLRSLKFLTILDGELALTNKAKTFMLKSSPYYKGDDILRKSNKDIHERVKSALLKGEASLKYGNESITQMWEKAKINTNTAEFFTHQMHQLMAYPAHHHCLQCSIKESAELVDLGGGSGAWAIELSKNNSGMKISIFDLPEVLDIARTIVRSQESNFSNINFVAGSFFDSIPESQNYLLSNILHDWPLDKCATLLSNIRKSMKDNGSLYIHECLLDESRITPTFTSLFNLLMAVNHNSQQFTFNELKNLVENQGFKNLEIISTVGHYQLLRCRKL